MCLPRKDQRSAVQTTFSVNGRMTRNLTTAGMSLLRRLRDKITRPLVRINVAAADGDGGNEQEAARRELEADDQWESIRAELAATTGVRIRHTATR
jgi:hypothetical protein